MVQRKQRKQQFSHSIGFLQIRVSRKNETFDPELGVIFHSSSHGFWVPDESGTGSPRTNPTPAQRLGLNFKPVPSSCMQLAHPSLPFGIESRKSLLSSGDTLVGNVPQKIVRRLPGFFLGLAYDDMHSQTEP